VIFDVVVVVVVVALPADAAYVTVGAGALFGPF
jgi:hypothetical protein